MENPNLYDHIYLQQDLKTKYEVMEFIRNIMKKHASVSNEYVNSFEKRDQDASVALGNYVALVHGTYETSVNIKENFVCFLELKNIIDWDDKKVKFVFGIAINNKMQLEIMTNIAIAFSDEDFVDQLLNKVDKKAIVDVLKGNF